LTPGWLVSSSDESTPKASYLHRPVRRRRDQQAHTVVHVLAVLVASYPNVRADRWARL